MTEGTKRIPLDCMGDTAHGLVSSEHDAPELRCDYCGRTVETHVNAHDEPVDAIRDFLEHCAFDHSPRATFTAYRPAERYSFPAAW